MIGKRNIPQFQGKVGLWAEKTDHTGFLILYRCKLHFGVILSSQSTAKVCTIGISVSHLILIIRPVRFRDSDCTLPPHRHHQLKITKRPQNVIYVYVGLKSTLNRKSPTKSSATGTFPQSQSHLTPHLRHN